MGNCLVLQGNKVIKIVKTDGKILEYRSPLKVHQVLSDFAGHAISESLPAVAVLHTDANLLCGRIYYIVPLPLPAAKVAAEKKKKVRFVDDEAVMGLEKKENGGIGGGGVRVKVLIRRKELEEMIAKGRVSVGDDERIGSRLKKIESGGSRSSLHGEEDDCRDEWSPALESIPEAIN